MKVLAKNAILARETATALRAELAGKIAFFVGSAEKLVTDVPDLTLILGTRPMHSASGTYEPSLAVVAQGRKTN